MLRIHLLGPFTINLDSQSLTNHDWRTQQTQTIGKILLTQRNKIVTSDQLIDVVWPDEPVESARRRLHVRISQLRKGLKEKSSLVKTVHGGYCFETDDSCWVDVDAFQSLITQGLQQQESGQQREAIQAYEKARSLYRGDFLAEDLYANWTFTQREFYRERYLNLLIQLSECYAQQGRYRLAITAAHQALNLDPLRETIYVRLMLYNYYSGDRTQSLILFDRYCQILEKELGVPPLDSTKQLVEQIRMGTLWKNAEAPRYPPPIYEGKLFEVPYSLDAIPFVNRDREYAWLVSQWKDPTTQVILIEGEAGIGKSRLVETFAGFITSQGIQVQQVRLSPGEQSPTAAVTASLRGLLTSNALDQLSPATLAVLAQHFPELGQRLDRLTQLPTLPLQAERQRFYQAISALAAVNSNTPTIFIVDDAHRLNATAVDLLKQLSKHIKILLSFRGIETPSNHPIRKACGSSGLKLEPLPKTAIQSIIRQLSKADHPFITDQINTHSRGNPLYVVTLLQHMFESGQLYVNSDGGWRMTDHDSLTIPLTLRATIEDRLQKLDRWKRRILDYTAILGGQCDFTTLQAASQQPDDILLTILDELIDSGLIIEPRSLNQADFRMSHDYYTEVTYETIPAIRRKQMHLQAAQAIEKLHAEQLENYYAILADHFYKSGKNEPAVHYAILAGEQASAQFASDEALHYFGRALTLLPIDDVHQRTRVLLGREIVYDLCGMRGPQNDNLTILETFSPLLSQEQRAEIHLRRAAYEWIVGNNSAANTAVQKAIQDAKACNAKPIEARAMLIAGKVNSIDPTQTIHYLNKARKLAQESKERALEGDIVRWLGNVNFWQNNFAKSQVHLEEALGIHQEVGDLRGELSALNNLGHLFGLLGQLQKAVDFYERAQEISIKINDRLAEGVLLTNMGRLSARLGKFKQAQDWLDNALVIRGEIANDEGAAVAHKNLGDVHRQQGNYQCALEHFQEAIDINSRIQHASQKGDSLIGLYTLYRELGDYHRAQMCLEEARTLLTDAASPPYIQGLIEEGLLSHLIGEHDRAISLAAQSLEKSKGHMSLHASAHKNMGHALAGLQNWDEAAQFYQKAAEIYQQNGQSFLTTEPLAGLAQLALIKDDLESAVTFAEEILQHIDKTHLQGPDRVLWIYLTCYHVMRQKEDARALTVLETAHALMNQRASSITEADLRTIFLQNISENRQISHIWETESISR